MRAVSWSELISPIWPAVKALAWVLDRAAIWSVVMPAIAEVASEGLRALRTLRARLE